MKLETSLLPVLQERLLHSLQPAIINGLLTDDIVAELREQIHKGSGTIDYARFGPAFAYRYTLANFANARRAIHPVVKRLSNLQGIRVLDLGCGAGASSAAILSVLSDCQMFSAKLDAVDHSGYQLALCANLLFDGEPIVESSVRIALHLDDALQFLRRRRSANWDLVVVSYLLCELAPQQADNIRSELRDGAENVVIIDFDRNEQKSFVQIGVDNARQYLTPDASCDATPLKALGLKTCPSGAVWFDAHPSSTLTGFRPELPDVLLRYFDIWERHDIDGVLALFATDAEYLIVGRSILSGAAEVASYWENNARQQRSVQWRVLKWHQLKDLIVAEWTCTFDRIDKELCYSLHGILWMETKGNCIRRFVECYHRTTAPLRDQLP